MEFITEKRQKMQELAFLEEPEKDGFGTTCLFNLLYKPELRAEANEKLLKTARWFQLSHPTTPGRDLQGEPDFVSIRMVRTIYLCDKYIYPHVKEEIIKFFTKEDFQSKYKSENHILMFSVSKLLAAQKFKDAYFSQYNMSASEMYEKEVEFLTEFIKFRAKRGWAEFDSLNYAPEIILCLLNIIDFCEDKKLCELSENALNLILLDMIADCLGSLYCGAHGRSYEHSVLDYKNSGMYEVFNYYFVPDAEVCRLESAICTSDFIPAKYVYDALNSKPDTYENYESKHLHSITMGPPQMFVLQVPGSINKYTYITPYYGIGAVNYQDPYPENSPAAWYSHHQQHEWDLTFSGGTDIRIFTHHPGSFGTEGAEHGYWSGDLCCLCGQVFCNKNTLIATYDIKKDKMQFIHANIPFKYFEVIKDDKYLFLKRDNIFVSLWFSNGYRIEDEGKYAEHEVLSDGNKHFVAVKVGTSEEYRDFDDFIKKIKEIKPVIDPDTMTMEYDNIKLNHNERFIDGKKVSFRYNTYESPIMFEEFGSGMVTVGKEAILDFN